MDTWKRRTALYVVGLIAVMLGFTLVYDYGVSAFDGRGRDRTGRTPGRRHRGRSHRVLALSDDTDTEFATLVVGDLNPDVEIVARAEQTLGQARVRARTDCTAVAVERNGDVITDAGPDVHVAEGDALVVAGTDDSVDRFRAVFD
nr:TrkA C-terminal domain-containing protein [Halomicrobium katesii]